MLVLKAYLAGPSKITSENKNNFQGKKLPQKIPRAGKGSRESLLEV